MDNIEKYDKVFMDTFSIEKETLKDLKYNKIEKWDSIGHMSLISDLEDNFKMPLYPNIHKHKISWNPTNGIFPGRIRAIVFFFLKEFISYLYIHLLIKSFFNILLHAFNE